MSQPDAVPEMPKPIGEGRSWHPVEDKLVEAYSLYVPYTMPEGYDTLKRQATLARIKGGAWVDSYHNAALAYGHDIPDETSAKPQPTVPISGGTV